MVAEAKRVGDKRFRESYGRYFEDFEIGLVSIIVVAISSIIERIFYVNEKKSENRNNSLILSFH